MADIILVDDDEDVREVLADFLRLEGHNVRIAEDGYDGLRLLTERLPELALLDVEMPHLTGPEMAYRMFVEDCGREFVPIVFVSGAVDLKQIAANVGTTYYVAKPFSLDVLSAILNRALHERAAPTYPYRDAARDAR